MLIKTDLQYQYIKINNSEKISVSEILILKLTLHRNENFFNLKNP